MKRILFYTACLALVTLHSCQEDFTTPEFTVDKISSKPVVFDINDLSAGAKERDDDGRRTILGPERENPFDVDVMNKAYNIVYGKDRRRIPSDYYVVFHPESYDDLVTLEDADLFLLDFPWTREILELGDYYYLSTDADDLPALYTTFSVSDKIPEVPYEIIAELNLAEKDPKVVQKAYEITGNGKEFAANWGNPKNGAKMENEMCFENDTQLEPADCGDGSGSGGGSSFITNDCGCEIYINQRKPGGCIQVDDTQYNEFMGVRRVRVVAKNSWFSWRRVETDDNGCWKVNREFRGRAWFFVKFKDRVSDRVKIRLAGVNGWRFWQKSFTAQHAVGQVNGPNFHDITIRYHRRTDTGTGNETHYTWSAATINNAVHEFHDVAATEGINAPPEINLMVMLNQSGGFAPMVRQIGFGDFRDALVDGLAVNNNPNQGPFGAPNPLNPLLILEDLIGVPLNILVYSPLLRYFLGDVNIGGNYFTSDLLKRLAFHELTHASHFTGVNEDWWTNLIIATVAARGHGNEDSFNAGYLSLAESWADHVAYTMLRELYPFPTVQNSNVINSFPSWGVQHEWIRNESDNHIPNGLYNDLIDGITPNETVYDESDLELQPNNTFNIILTHPLIDKVDSAFDNAFFQENLDETVNSPEDLFSICEENLPPTTSLIDLVRLFQEYGIDV
ncbi:MAG: hypothetical protein AAGF89_05060 [Bacteroidota bacterium]